VAAVVVAALFAVSAAMDGEEPETEIGKESMLAKLDNNEVLSALKVAIQEKWEKWNGEDNEILPADFDEETEKVMDMMDVAEDFMREEEEFEEEITESEDESSVESEEEYEEEDDSENTEGRRGRHHHRGGRKKGQHRQTMNLIKHHNRAHQKQMFKSMEVPRRCLDMESQIEALCSRVKLAKHNPTLEKLYMVMSQNSKKAGWNTCCLEDESDRMACFAMQKAMRMEKMCTEEKGQLKYRDCCDAEDREECVAEYKAKVCSNDSDEMAGKIGKRGRGHKGKKGKHGKRGGKNKHSFDEERFEECCAAGNSSSEAAAFSGSPEECLDNYMRWTEEENQTDFSCVKGYLSCCISENSNGMEIKSVYRKAFSALKKDFYSGEDSYESEEEEDEEMDQTIVRPRGRGPRGPSDVKSRQGLKKKIGDKLAERKNQNGKSVGRGRQGRKKQDEDIETISGRDKAMKMNGKKGRQMMKARKLKARQQERKERKQERRQDKLAVREASLTPEEELIIVEEELIIPDETGQQIEEIMYEKTTTISFFVEEDEGKKDYKKKYPRRKLPDGMRMDDHGHKYFVDKLPEDWDTRADRRVERRKGY